MMKLHDIHLFMSLSTSLLYIKHVWKVRWHFILGVALLMASVPSLLVFPVSASATVALFGGLVSIVSAIVEIKKARKTESEYLFVDSTILNRRDLKLDRSLVKSGYALENSGSKTVLVSEKVNEYLGNGGKIEFQYLNEKWELPRELREEWKGRLLQKAKREKRIIFDSGKVRLLNDLGISDVEGSIKVKIQPTTYLHGFWTNEAALLDLKQNSETVYRGDRLYMLENFVSTLSDSKCANSIGVSTLLIGGGSKLPLVTQSARSAVSNSKIAPSGSGSMDLEDIQEGDLDFNSVICRAAERELVEEMGLSKEIKLKSQVIGFSRLLARGGKPEFFCVTWLDSEIKQIELTKVERLFTHSPMDAVVDWGDTKKNIASRLKNLVKTNESTYSISLQCSLEALANALVNAKSSAPFLSALPSQSSPIPRSNSKKSGN